MACLVWESVLFSAILGAIVDLGFCARLRALLLASSLCVCDSLLGLGVRALVCNHAISEDIHSAYGQMEATDM